METTTRLETDKKDVQFICKWGDILTPDIRRMEMTTGWRFSKSYDGTIRMFVPRSSANRLSVGCPIEFSFGTLHVLKRIA